MKAVELSHAFAFSAFGTSRRMSQQGVPPNVVTYGAAARAATRMGATNLTGAKPRVREVKG